MMEIRPVAVVIDTELNDANGYELLHEYKQRQELTHIPAIIISDFDNDRSLIRAIKSEADDYLQKPFNSKVLTVMLIKKIKMCLPAITDGDCQRKVAKDELQNDPTSTYDEKNIILEKRSDKRFISLLNILIANNLSNADFGVNLLAEMMKISRGQLYRKIKELHDMTPVEYLRRKRLSHAAELIEESNITIQEIMLHVGMPDATNFYKRFKEMYGMNPTEYRNR
jgi:AraC-like DNA-binding protein